MAQGSAVIVGAGGGLGAALARRFAKGGLAVAVARRDEAGLAPLVEEITQGGGRARGYRCNATDESSVERLFERAEADLGPLRVAVYNASTLVISPIAEQTEDDFRLMWETNCLGGFLTGRAAARRMLPRKEGAIFFTGSREAKRGFAHFAGHCSGKFALRGLAESMARELLPHNIHVVHTVIDGLIDAPHTRQFLEGVMDLPETLMDPNHIAESYWSVYEQKRDAWTFELDLRPWYREW